VQGCGIDVVYPRENYDLLQTIAQRGAVLSEFPIGTPPTGNNFPRRNRILSGMTRGVLVVEAPEQSGALITGREAADQGREVFAVPGNIFNPMSKGVNRLIQDGAKLVMDVKDILDELQVAVMEAETRTAVEAILPESPIEATLLQLLEADPVHIDVLIQTSGLPASEVAATLMMLELKGLAQNVGAMQYCRTH
jgi:DNA processing protein